MHCPPKPDHEDCCITPTLVLHPTSKYPRERSINSLQSSPSSQLHTIHLLSGAMNTVCPSSNHPGRSNATNNVSTQDNSMNSALLHPLRNVVDSVRKRFNKHHRSAKSVDWKIPVNNDQRLQSGISCELPEANSGMVKHGSDDKDLVKVSGIFGYMYQFGIWDAQSPILDPRLPITDETAETTWTVKARCPEWHHAEVCLDSTSMTPGDREPLVRGRIVACLQRFTQHNPASGQSLHRSTYVQQTRLFRQRDRQVTTMNADKSSIKDIKLCSGLDENVKNGTTTKHLGPLDDTESGHAFSQSRANPVGCANSAEVPESKASKGNHQPARCSPERLQLLQSICPSAAAANTLLGHRLTKQRISLLETDSEEDGMESKSSNFDYPLVTATTWCPPAFITRDPSPYLVFQRSCEEPRPSSKHMKTKMLTAVPQLLIRGGTLDGLLAYTLQSLMQRPSASPWDSLFHHVFRVTYPTFTTSERVVEKLIQFYVAWAPVEPGCQSTNWNEALLAANFLVTVAKELHPDQLTTRLVLRLARFARLLILDGLEREKHHTDTEDSPQHNTVNNTATTRLKPYFTEHKSLADALFESIPLVSAAAQLRERMSLSITTASARVQRSNGSMRVESEKLYKTSNHRNKASLLPELRNETSDTVGTLSPNKGIHNEVFTNLSCALKRTEQLVRCDSQLLAREITRMEEEMFSQINFHEFLDIHRLERGESPTLSRCVEHFNRTTSWARSLLFVLGPALGQWLSSTYTIGPTGRMRDVSNHRITCQQSILPMSCSQNIDKYRDANEERSPYFFDVPDFNTLVASKIGKETESNSQTSVGSDLMCAREAGTSVSKRNVLPIHAKCYVNIIFGKLCDILKHLKALKNFSSLLALLLAVQQVPECMLSRRSKMLVSKFSSYMKPPTFAEYRRDLEGSSLPCLPYLGLIFQQLIHLRAGNSIYLNQETEETHVEEASDGVDQDATKIADRTGLTRPPEHIINIWRCWKHYLILGYFLKRKENPEKNLHHIPCIKEVQAIINGFCDTFPDDLLEKAKERLVRSVKTKRT
ncbi:unnamed protein product [Dicrocoelium dendriticum]|nr:unnamed protein product [Dicrocoelium dendriticum]